MAVKKQPSEQQLGYLESAKLAESSGNADSIGYYLYRTVTDLKKGEPLAPEWKRLWEGIRNEAEKGYLIPLPIVEEIKKAIQGIDFLDQQIESIKLTENDQVCLLLGAGASAPAPSSIPTVMHLLPELWRRARKIGREDIDRLADWCNSQGVNNIEDLLTAAYIANFAAKHSSVTGLLDYFLFTAGSSEGTIARRSSSRKSAPNVDAASIALLQDTLQVLFGLLTGTMIPAPPNPAHDAIVSFVKRHSKSFLVTTNYDGCIDEALMKASVNLNTYVDEAIKVPENAIDLIKIHGSINWTYCDSCHEVREFNLLNLKDTYKDDSYSYAVIGICKKCGGQRRPLLIPPIGFKFIIFPNLIRLWNTAREAIERADYLIVVGYSFSEADTYINKIIERSMTLNEKQKIIVCDPNANLVPLLRDRYSSHMDSFDVNRILAAVGSADEMLPQVLTAITSSKQPTSCSKKKMTQNGKAKQSRSKVHLAA